MEYKYRFAGVDFLIRIPEEEKYTDEYRLGIFRANTVDDPYIYQFEMVEELAEPEGECIINIADFRIYEHENYRVRYIGSVEKTLEGAYIRVINNGKDNLVQLQKSKFKNSIGAKTVLNSIEVEHLIALAGGFILHCSYIEVDGKAILFTAPSETGKSTQAELWKKYRNAEIINGDRAAVRVEECRIIAEGIPFSGSSNYCKNRTLPIEAIVYLSQASENSICRLKGYQAFSKIWEGVSFNYWEKQDMELVSFAVQEVAKNVPIFHLACTPDESAILTLEQALRKKENL